METLKHFSMFFKEIPSQIQHVCVFDIETIPDSEKVETYYTDEELQQKQSEYEISLGFHKVVAFSYAIVDFSKFKIIENDAFVNVDDELGLLSQIHNTLSKYTKFSTFNGKNYDLPVLERRSLLNGLRYKRERNVDYLKHLYVLANDLQNQPWNHLDLFQVLNMHRQKGGLNLLVDQLGLTKYNNLRGNQVAELVRSGDTETLYNYAKHDAYLEATLLIEVVDFFKK